MKYNLQTGKRIKDENTKGRINWVHSILKRSGNLPEEWELTQCLFEEQLLKEFPDATVALVESEKTAIICSGLIPEYLWLATGEKSQFNERLKVLIGRDVVAFPDVDGYKHGATKSRIFQTSTLASAIFCKEMPQLRTSRITLILRTGLSDGSYTQKNS